MEFKVREVEGGEEKSLAQREQEVPDQHEQQQEEVVEQQQEETSQEDTLTDDRVLEFLGNKLMAELGLMKESAEKLIKQYHARAPFVKQLMNNVSRKANDRGKIRTLLCRS